MSRYGLQGRWTFTQCNDLDFARQWDAALTVDVVFIDTSHKPEQTRLEIAAYAPLLAPHGAMAFHDTVSEKEGVLIPIEEFLRAHPDAFAFEHFQDCFGLGIVSRR